MNIEDYKREMEKNGRVCVPNPHGSVFIVKPEESDDCIGSVTTSFEGQAGAGPRWEMSIVDEAQIMDMIKALVALMHIKREERDHGQA